MLYLNAYINYELLTYFSRFGFAAKKRKSIAY